MIPGLATPAVLHVPAWSVFGSVPEIPIAERIIRCRLGALIQGIFVGPASIENDRLHKLTGSIECVAAQPRIAV